MKTIEQVCDDTLAIEFIQGSEQSFTELMNRYHGKIFKTIYGMTGHYYDTIDLTQDVFFQVYTHLHGYRPNGKFSAWLFRIAINRCRTYVRKKKLVTFFSLDMLPGKYIAATIDTNTDRDFENAVEQTERQHMIQAALKDLDARSKEILVLKEIDQMEYKEIADTLGIKIGTVKSRLARAREKLKQQLIKKGIHKWI